MKPINPTLEVKYSFDILVNTLITLTGNTGATISPSLYYPQTFTN